MLDDTLKNDVLKILEDEQDRLKGCLEPQTNVNVPETIPVVEAKQNPDGTLTEKVVQEPSNYVQEGIDLEYRKQFGKNSETLFKFCKIVDDRILELNSTINAKKQEIVTLSTEATNGKCWPDIKTGIDPLSGDPITIDYREFVDVNKDIEKIRIYPNIAGPTVRYDVKNPFEPDDIYTLNSTYKGYGYLNLRDQNCYKNKDGTKTGLLIDGSGDSIGNGRFDISNVLTDHNPVGNFLLLSYPGATNPSRCVAIANSITAIYNEVLVLRAEKDSLRNDLNTIKDNKKEKDLAAWGIERINNQIKERETKNASAIAAVKKFNNNVTVSSDGTVLNLDVSNPDSYSGIGTDWFDISGNGNTACLFPITNAAEYVYADGYYLRFNGTNQYAQTGITTAKSDILGNGTNWAIESWFRINGAPSDTGYANVIVDVNASGTTSHMLSVSYGQNGIFSGVPTNKLVYTTANNAGTNHLTSTNTISNGKWYHGVVVRNGTTNTKLYLNGTLVSTYAGNFSLGTNSKSYTKIAAWTNETSFSKISISAVRIYQKSFTDAEIYDKFKKTKGKFGIVG